jgi:hypothetical protein
MIFFNDEGTENGGMTFTGRRNPDGSFRASSGLSFDQFDQDQVLVLDYSDNNTQRNVGMSILDRANVPIDVAVRLSDSIKAMPAGPEKDAATKRFMEPRPGEPLAAQRLVVGRDRAKNAVVSLHDKFGKPRLRLVVDSLGVARILFLDSLGKVTHSIPETTR